jgi:hypothetical protein
MPAYCAIVELGGHPVCDQSAEQHGELCALVVIASTNPQFTTDPYDKRPNNVQSQSFAGGWIESVRQNGAIIGDRQRVALSEIWFQPDRDPAFAVLSRVRDQLVDDEAERNAGDGRQLDIDSLDDDDLSAPDDRIVEKSRQRPSRYCLSEKACTPSNEWRRWWMRPITAMRLAATANCEATSAFADL